MMSVSPYLIGIAGPTCSGKTRLANYLSKKLFGKKVIVISLDSYYRDLSHLEPRECEWHNFDLPDSLDVALLKKQLKILAEGVEIEKPVYHFGLHKREPKGERINPGEVVIIEGLFPLYWKEVRELLNTRIFILAEDEVCLSRRLKRDQKERGLSPKVIRAQYINTVRPMYKQYVLPTQWFADLTIRGETEDYFPAIVEYLRKELSS